MSDHHTDEEARPLQETNRLSARVRRYARVGASVSGLAARASADRVAGRITGRHASNQDKGADLRHALGTLKGPLMKIGQMLANIPDAVPEDMASELVNLQSNAPPMGWSFVRRRMATELGPDWRDKFASFEREATKAASLGQVHAASDHTGRRLACKLQYPDMDSTLEADLNQLRLALRIYKRMDSTINFDKAIEEICARLREELDYEREAVNIRIYRHIFSHYPEFCIPEVIPELSTRKLLTMSWLPGHPVQDHLDSSQEVRNHISSLLYKGWYIPFYHHGIINGDPHMGNYTVASSPEMAMTDSQINLMDFGLVRIFPPEIVMATVNLFHGLDTHDESRTVEAYRVLMGAEPASREILEAANIWSQFLFKSVLTKGTVDLREIQNTASGREAAHKMHQKMKALGGDVSLPAVFVFLDRAAVGLGGALLRLGPLLNCREIFLELIDGLTLEKLQANQDAALKAGGFKTGL